MERNKESEGMNEWKNEMNEQQQHQQQQRFELDKFYKFSRTLQSNLLILNIKESSLSSVTQMPVALAEDVHVFLIYTQNKLTYLGFKGREKQPQKAELIIYKY